MLIIYHHFTEQLESVDFNQLLRRLPQDQRIAVNRYHRWQDRHATLFGKLMIIQGFMHYGFQRSPLPNLKSSEYGRPYLPHSIDFNVSHSKDYVVCAFSKHRVGLDIEYVDYSIQFSDFKDFFDPKEWDTIYKSSDKVKNFFRLWCQKESVIKIDGRGFSAPLDKLRIQEEKAYLEGQRYFLREIQLDPSYQTFLAQETPVVSFETIPFQLKTL